ncbi:MAG: T9SS type A sorting domain-containing protein [Ignavibacteriales bacterium]|nr:T9SS type A sorting domain-containing protein [Ignavibacteriales bacterium]
MKSLKIILALLFSVCLSYSADSVDVVFRYNFAKDTIPTVPGTFNNWNNSAWPMTKSAGDLWIRTARLALGTYQYKFYVRTTLWPNDPLNHHVFPDANQNSILYVKNPTIYHFTPNQRNPVVNTSLPTITAYLFPLVGTEVDTSTLSLKIDSDLYTGIGSAYDFITKKFSFTPSEPLANGNHIIILTAGANADTVNFTTRGGFVQLLNLFPFDTWKSRWQLNGIVEDSTISTLWIVRNHTDSFNVNVNNKLFSYSVPLIEGENSFIAIADSSGSTVTSSPVIFSRKINHSPNASITFYPSGGNLTFYATSSSDPDSGQTNLLTFLWHADTSNPQYISEIDNSTQKTIPVQKPVTSGEYYFTLVATDPNGNKDTTRNYFTVDNIGNVISSTYMTNPTWAREARVYFLFPKAFSTEGTINAAKPKLQYIKDLGFNVIWLMPVMKNAYPIDNGVGPGYNIVDFYNVAPEYGTNIDLKNFIEDAHKLGIKIILDITPNHTSRFHPWSIDAHTFKKNSYYWNWYQHEYIIHNENGLGQSADADSFWYYSGFSDQLLNYNWLDEDARAEMINVYKYWTKYFDADGFRFDVYWGPHRRYGERYMGQPVRKALKHIKPDILLLAEDDGTGSGTESIYADYAFIDVRGGVDASYDFKMYRNAVVNFGFSSTAINNLQNEIDNAGFYPGENSLYMRFMESQDEDRIFYTDPNPSTYYNSDPVTAFKKTMPMASVLFTAPGFPMLWNGQEVGWGYGITGSKLARNRSVINWDFQGKTILTPHYQKLANIRGQFPAFTQHKRDTNHDGYVNSSDSSDFIRVASSNSLVYSFSRPYQDQNGLTVVNVSNAEQTAILNLAVPNVMKFAGGVQPSSYYYLNNLYNNTREQLPGSAFDSVTVTIPPYGSAIYTVSLTPDSVIIDNPIVSVDQQPLKPLEYVLEQNYPNPFNPTTNFQFTIANCQLTILKVYDVLGREVVTLVNEVRQPGTYTVQWNAAGLPSGVYFYRLSSGNFSDVKKMILIR